MTTTLHTPVGTAQFPYLTKPDTKFDPEGSYKCNLLVDPKDPQVAAFLAQVKSILDKHLSEVIAENPKAKRLVPSSPIADELDDNGDETGKVVIKATAKAGGVRKDGSKWTRTIPLFDSRGQKVQANPGGGSVLRLAVTPNPFYNGAKVGLSLRLEAVQIIKLREFTGGSPEVSFGAVEGGFVAEADEVSPQITADDF